MKVDNISVHNRYKQMNNRPSFAAIHPVKYCLKASDGKYYYISDGDVIRKLQRILVNWLNAHHNDFNRMIKGEQTKPKNMRAGDKLIRERLVNFFINNDSDYKAERLVRSAYIDNPGGTVTPYIVTGKHATKIDDASKCIEDVHRSINDSRDMRADYLSARTRDDIPLSEVDKYNIQQAKQNYHRQKGILVKSLMENPEVDKSSVIFYFESVPVSGKQKGSKFRLVNALIQKFMI